MGAIFFIMVVTTRYCSIISWSKQSVNFQGFTELDREGQQIGTLLRSVSGGSNPLWDVKKSA